jgi:hypothetical protein
MLTALGQGVFDLTLSLKVSGLAPMLVFPYFFLHYLRTVINYMSVQMLRNKHNLSGPSFF